MSGKVLITKKLDFQQKSLFWNAGIDIIERPVLGIEPVYDLGSLKRNISSKDFNVWVFTSQNAVYVLEEVAGDLLQFNKPGYVAALAPRTKNQLESLGIEVKISAGNGQDLTAKIIRIQGIRNVLYLAGERNTGEIQKGLDSAGINFRVVTLYRSKCLYPTLADLEYQHVVFFSPSGVESYLKNNNYNNRKVFAIGKRTADYAALNYDGEILYPSSPNMNEIAELLKKAS